MSKNENFFKEQLNQSSIKSNIVSKYFGAWAKVIIGTQKRYLHKAQTIAYIDLFAGPGRYDDGSLSTPLRILADAVDSTDLNERLVSIFNDKNSDNSISLENAIFEMDNISKMKYQPKVLNQEIRNDIFKEFENVKLIPTFFFVDPWGYKGLSLRLVNSVVKNWGCDSVFFFNYNRINMGLNNDKVKSHMAALFSNEKLNNLREMIKNKRPSQREEIIIKELCDALKGFGCNYTLPFRFMSNKKNKISHHLIFVSKNFRGYDVMKDIMAKESTNCIQGVPTFTYDPIDLLPEQQTVLFELKPFDELKQQLLEKFKGKSLTMYEIYEEHTIDTLYVKKNYKDALKELLEENKIMAVSKDGKPPKKGTFADDIKVTFN